MYDSPAPGVDGGNLLSQKMVEVTRYTIISLDVHLNGMVDQADLMCSLLFWMKRSISGTYSFLDAKFRFMPRAVLCLA